jgi:type VI protein secretion system component Hcp
MPVRPLSYWSRPAIAALGLFLLTLLASAAPPAVAQTPPTRPAKPTPRINQQPIGNLRLTVDGPAGAGLAPIPLVGFAIEVSQPATIGSATGGAGAGKVIFNEAVVVKQIDATTPRLFELLAGGAAIQSAEINLCQSGSDCTSMTALVSYTLRTAFLTDLSDTGGAPSTEELSFAYGALSIRAGQVTACRNRDENAACPDNPSTP